MTHDLTVRQREELKELIKEANEKEHQDETGSFMYRVRGPSMDVEDQENCQKQIGNGHTHTQKTKFK